MSWRIIQLGNNNCDQDDIILSIYKTTPVKYIGDDRLINRLDNFTSIIPDLFLSVEFVFSLDITNKFFLKLIKKKIL